MRVISVLRRITNGYSPMESFRFDRFVACIAAPLHELAMTRISTVVRPGARILDVGCGGGQFALWLADRFPDVSIVDLDLSPGQVALGRGPAEPRCAATCPSSKA